MSTFVIGDIHGELDQLKKLIQEMNLNDEDNLYILGDVVDKGSSSIKTLQYLMSMPNCTCLAGNHELMMLENMKILLNEITDNFLTNLSSEHLEQLADWINNGGSKTISEFAKLSAKERKDIIDFIGEFEAFAEVEINGQQYLLVHAGINNFSREKGLDEYYIDDLVWTRPNYERAYFDNVIVITGHTPTQLIPENPRPGYIYKANNHIAMDCGACFPNGRLAGICLETGEEFYSR